MDDSQPDGPDTPPAIVEPPAAAIDWHLFRSAIRLKWDARVELKEATGLSAGSTLQNAWDGNPIGLVPFLIICQRLGYNPLKFLQERGLCRG